MQNLLLFSLALTTVTTVGTIVFSYKIMRMHVTPSLTWSLKLLAMSIQLFQIGLSLFYVNDTARLLSAFPPEAAVVSYAVGAIRNALIFAFVARIYYTLRAKFEGIDVPEI